MNVFKRAFTPTESKMKKKKGLPALRNVKTKSKPAFNPLDSGDLNQFAYQSQAEEVPLADGHKKPLMKGQFTINNLRIKQFTDEEIQDCFDCFDLDGNGFISAAEISQCFKKLGEKNGDGQIESEEFRDMVYKEAGIHHHRAKSKEPSASVSRMMTKMTSSNPEQLEEQRIRKKRLKVLLLNLEFDEKSMKEIHDNFVLMCSGNHEPGMIDFADFCACTKVPVTAESKELYGLFQREMFDGEHIDYRFFLIALVSLLAPNLEMKIGFAFEVFDVDGNGLIDRDEMMAVVAATQLLRGKALKERVDKIMELADTDGNEELDMDEFAVCCRRYQTLIFPKV